MSQQDFLDTFDLGFLAPDAAGFLTSNVPFMQHVEGDIGNVFQHQTLAERMQGDKKDTLSTLSFGAKMDDLPTYGQSYQDDEWLEASSDMREMMELAELEEVKQEVKDENDHQPLIDEVADFLTRYETSFPIVDVSGQADECPMNSSSFGDDAKISADEIIDDLFRNTIALELTDEEQNNFVYPDEKISNQDFLELDEEEEANESGYVSSLNMSEMQMEDGTNVIFVIDCDDSASHINVASVQSDAMSGVMSPVQDSDESWSPASATSSKRKPSAPRGLRRTKHPVIDKKERKKIQNVEAARRYRDKKKSEQQLLDEELDELSVKNTELKSIVNEKENELKTLKKLMAELGLIKIKK